jgi:hypothetical protein
MNEVKTEYLTAEEARTILLDGGQVTNGIHFFGSERGGCHSGENCCAIEFKDIDEAMHYMARTTNFKNLRRL